MFKIIEILIAIGLVLVCSGCSVSIENKATSYQKQIKSERNNFQKDADYEIEADEYYHVLV